MSDELTDGLRASIAAHAAVVRAVADPECRICHGRGWTTGYVAPSKMAEYPCVCTGHGYNRTSAEDTA